MKEAFSKMIPSVPARISYSYFKLEIQSRLINNNAKAWRTLLIGWPLWHGFVHWFYNLENTIPIHVHACTILENPFPINVHEYYILENPIHINVRTSLQTKITVKLNIKIWKYLLQKCVFCVHFDDFLFDMTHKGIENLL